MVVELRRKRRRMREKVGRGGGGGGMVAGVVMGREGWRRKKVGRGISKKDWIFGSMGF